MYFALRVGKKKKLCDQIYSIGRLAYCVPTPEIFKNWKILEIDCSSTRDKFVEEKASSYKDITINPTPNRNDVLFTMSSAGIASTETYKSCIHGNTCNVYRTVFDRFLLGT